MSQKRGKKERKENMGKPESFFHRKKRLNYTLELKARLYAVSNNALHSGYSVCRTCARLQGHVHHRIQASFYRTIPRCRCSCRARCGAARRSPPRRSQEQVSINSHECAWFVRETTFSYERDTIRASAKYSVFLAFLRIILQIE